MSLDPQDQDVKTRTSEEDVPLAGVPGGVELGSRLGHQVRLTEHGKESEGEAHLQGRTKVPRAGSEGGDLMEKRGKDGQTS